MKTGSPDPPTFMFTDIEGSTARWQADPAAMAELLAQHDRVMRSVVTSHGGEVFKHTGDGIGAVFAAADAAVTAAAEIQGTVELPVRIGVHTGPAEHRDGDYFGTTLNMTARIMDAGHGGQILASPTTVALLDDPGAVDLGEYRLKGLPTAERIFQIGMGSFPSLRAPAARVGNLPLELSTFVGRAHELDEFGALVSECRLVTLLGVGGTGKTRLAIEIAEFLASTFPDGCWLAELAIITTAEAVPLGIARGLEIREPSQGDLVEHLVRRIGERRLLLVVDNCEHVLDGVADVVLAILEGCPNVTILATSREPLLVPGEHIAPTPSLAVTDAVELFVTRARSEAPDLELDDGQLRAARTICERLDHLPLAIELAASRLRSMTPIEMEAKLDERFRLTLGRRHGAERHRTMHAAVDWSYRLCSATEQLVFDRLSVFVADFDLEAACAIATADGLDDRDAADAVALLVDRSLVRRITGPEGTSRFRLLETMRAFGLDRLGSTGGLADARDRHAAHIADRIAALSFSALGPDERATHRRMRDLLPDALVAVGWSVEQQDWARAYRISSALYFAAPGPSLAMLQQTARAMTKVDGAHDSLPPLAGLALTNYIGVDDWYEHLRSWSRTLDLDDLATRLRADAVAGRDHAGLPMLNWSTSGAEMRGLLREYLESLTAPPVVRFIEEYAFADTLLQGLHIDEAAERLPRLEALADGLGSAHARRQCHALAAVVLEQRGELLPAAERSAASVRGVEHPDVVDMSASYRHVRITARAGLPLTGADIRRPIDWVLAESHVRHWPAVLTSLAIALDIMGEEQLADRALDQVAPAGVRELFRPAYRHIMSPRLVQRFASDPEPRERLDDLVEAVRAFADDLDG